MDDLLIWIVLLSVAWLAESIASARRRKRRQGSDRRPSRHAPPMPTPELPDARETSDASRTRERRERVVRPRTARPEPLHRRSEPARSEAPQPWETSAPEPVVFPPELIIVGERREQPPRQAPVLVPESPPRPPPTPEPEATRVALETLEPVGEATHEEFHAKYVDRHEVPHTLRRVPRLRLADVRRGIILAEILGPPRSER